MKYITKVVSQFVQFLSDNRTVNTFEEAIVMDEESFEPVEVPQCSHNDGVI
jgi:hypothetical protein